MGDQTEQSTEPSRRMAVLDGVSERLIGWACLGLAGTEWVDPSVFQIDISQAMGFGVFGFLVATGRANEVVKYLATRLLK
jgi:hypothetical protein